MRYALVIATTLFQLSCADWLKSRDYDGIDTLTQSLSSKCLHGDPSVKCSDDLSICALSGPVAVQARRKPEITVECKLAPSQHYHPYGWSIVEGSPQHHNCATFLGEAVVVESDLLGNLYHNFNLLLHAAVSEQLARTHFAMTGPTVLILDYEGSNRFPKLWKVFRSVTYLPKEGCVKLGKAVLALRTRSEKDLLWSPIIQPLPEGSRMLRDIAGKVKTTLLTTPPSPSPAILYIRRATKDRRILNERELLSALRLHHTVTEVGFDGGSPSFEEQLSIVSSHHILLSVHGAALTHAAFLHPPAALFELFNAGEDHCYRTFASLFRVAYYTLERRDVRVTYGKRPERQRWVTPKTGNYTLNTDRVVAIVRQIYLDLQLNVHNEL